MGDRERLWGKVGVVIPKCVNRIDGWSRQNVTCSIEQRDRNKEAKEGTRHQH